MFVKNFSENPSKYVKTSIFFVVLFFALYSLFVFFTGSIDTLFSANVFFVVLALVSFLFSIFFWVVSWGFFIRKHASISYKQIILVGFSCVYGSLTPIQVGTEALRSFRAKSFFSVAYSKSISASFLVKGLKFLVIAIFSFVSLFFLLFFVEVDFLIFVGLLSGFIIIWLATFIFLIPLNKTVSNKLSKFFSFLSLKISFFKKVDSSFRNYSKHFVSVSKKELVYILFLSIVSWFLEFFALWFCFFAFSLYIDFFSVLLLFVLFSILERAPFLPRGIGLVETLGYFFLSSAVFGFSFSIPLVASVLFLFGFVRLIFPTIFSLFVDLVFLNIFKNKFFK